MNVIHDRPYNGSSGLYLDSIDRGPEGKEGPRGKEGEEGKQGKTGISVTAIYVDDNDHLITEMSDGSKTDAGELPKVVTRRIAVATLDGIAKTIALDAVINPDRVSHILINGVTYTEGFTITDNAITLNFADENIPTGKLEVFVNAHSRAGEVDIPVDFKPMTDEELLAILEKEEE